MVRIKYFTSFLTVMLILFVTALSSSTVQAADSLVLMGTNAANVDTTVQWTDSSKFFSVTKRWNPNTHSYENNTISNTKTLRIACTGDLTSPILVTITFLCDRECGLKPLFLPPEGGLFYNISENRITFSIDRENTYDVSLRLTGDGIDELDVNEKSIGQILVTTETGQFINQQVTVMAKEEEIESKEELKNGIETTEEITKESSDNQIRNGESQDNQELAEENQQEAESITRLPDAVNGQYYEKNILAGDNEAAICKIVEGVLPQGMVLKRDGFIVGIPEDAEGIYTIVVVTGDNSNEIIKYTMELSALEKDIPWVDKMPDSVVGTEYTADLMEDCVPTTWSMVGGTLPEGFALLPDGTLIGIPEKAGEFSFDVLESNGIVADQITTQTITVYENDELSMSDGGTVPNAVLGKPYEYLFQPGMKSRINWMVEEGTSLPSGLILAEGKIVGIPEKAGIYSVSIIAEIAENYKINKSMEFVIEERPEENELEFSEETVKETQEEPLTESVNGETSEM